MADTGTYLNAVMVLSGKCAALRQQLADANAEIARLRAALEPFANVVVPRGLHGVLRIWDGRGTYPMLMLTTDHLEAARKALEGGE